MSRTGISIPYVTKHEKGSGRPASYRYRRVVPPAMRATIGRKVWLKSFRADASLAYIERTARRLAAEHELQIAAAKGGGLTPEVQADIEAQARDWLSGDKAKLYELVAFLTDEARSGHDPRAAALVNAIEHGGRYTPAGVTLTAAYAEDKRLLEGTRSEPPIAYAVNLFVSGIGDKDVTVISYADVEDWLVGLRKAGTLDPATVKRRLGSLRGVLTRAFRRIEHKGENPFAGHKIDGSAPSRDDRHSFNRVMLAKIDSYLDTSRRLRPETRNILKLMKCTGAGPAEIGGLVLADVELDQPIPAIWIRANAARGLKTEERPRRVPLVGDALTAAKDAHKRALVRSKGKSHDLVPVFTSYGANGRGADWISAKINAAIRRAGVTDKKLVAYSYRHTLKDAMRAAKVPEHIQRALLGHAGKGSADNYGSREWLTESRDAIEAALRCLGGDEA